MSAVWNGCHSSRQSVRSGQFRYKTRHAVCTKQQIRYHYNDNRVIFIKHWWFVKWCRKLIFSITGDRPSISAVKGLISLWLSGLPSFKQTYEFKVLPTNTYFEHTEFPQFIGLIPYHYCFCSYPRKQGEWCSEGFDEIIRPAPEGA